MTTTAVNISDEKILELLTQQQASSMERGMRMMMDKYQSRLFSTIYKIVGNTEDAADVLQNSFIKAYRAIGRFEKKAQLYTWLYRIATNESLTFLRKKKKSKTLGLEEMPGVANQITSSNTIESEKIESLLQDAIDSLPEKQQVVFMMRYYDEMPYDEMAEKLGTSTGSLKHRFTMLSKR